MNWLDQIRIGRDLTICPDCDIEYEVIGEFQAKKKPPQGSGLEILNELLSDEYYIALRCPKCLENRHLIIKSIDQKTFERTRDTTTDV